MTQQYGQGAAGMRPMGGGGRQSTYGQGLGPIYQFGAANPAGPYAGLDRAPGAGGPAGGAGGPAGGAESAAMKYLSGVVSGENTPYNESTRSSMYSQASGMNAAAEGAQNAQLQSSIAAGGASSTDPSAMTALRQNMAARQGANQRSMGDIDRTANLANQGAQQQAAGTLLSNETAREMAMKSQNQSASNAAMSYLYGGGGGASQNRGGNNFQNSFGLSNETSGQAADRVAYQTQLRMQQNAREDAARNNRNRTSRPSNGAPSNSGVTDMRKTMTEGPYWQQ